MYFTILSFTELTHTFIMELNFNCVGSRKCERTTIKAVDLTHEAGDVMTEYILTRTDRKTIAIYVRDGFVEVRAPYKKSVSEINEFVASKEKWIADKLAAKNEQIKKRESFTLTYGDQIPYRGKLYPIKGKPGDMAGFNVISFYMPPDLPPDDIKHYCKTTYRKLAERDLIDRTIELMDEMDIQPSAVKINNAKATWGSCSSKKSINFSWRLIMADDDVIDYLIVHELAHILEPNHSKRFWAIVESFIPDFKERKARLKALERKLGSEDWG